MRPSIRAVAAGALRRRGSTANGADAHGACNPASLEINPKEEAIMVLRIIKGGALALVAGVATSAAADLRICNHSGVRTWVAVASEQSGTFQSRGWWEVPPNGACVTAVRGALRQRYLYVYGYDEEGMEVGGYDRFCVIPGRTFSLVDADWRCDGPGRQWREFLEVDTRGEAHFTFDIHDKK